MIATEKRKVLPGTRPEGTRDEHEAAARVRAMFAEIAPRYDFLNRVISFRLDQVWRRRTAKRFVHILQRPDARVLDLCCGTGDLAFALDRARATLLGRPLGGRSFSSDRSPDSAPGVLTPEGSGRPFPIIGGDFAEPMLARAHEKARAPNRAVAFTAADALRLPFADASFDLVTTAFGFRNLANYEAGLREFARVLKRGGELGVLEFTEPTAGQMAGLFLIYFRHILPRIGETVSRNSGAYAYLPKSVSKFPSVAELSALIERAGFTNVRAASWNFGSVILHSAQRA